MGGDALTKSKIRRIGKKHLAGEINNFSSRFVLLFNRNSLFLCRPIVETAVEHGHSGAEIRIISS